MNTFDGFSHTKADRLSWRIANDSAPTLFYILCVLLISFRPYSSVGRAVDL